MTKFLKSKPSFYTFIFLSIAIIFGRFLLPRFQTYDILSIISWDVFGYYLYLPATFIYNDLGLRNFTWVQHLLDVYNPTIGFYQAYIGPEGDYIMKYTMGWAMAYAPFFFIGHLFAWIFGFPTDGFSLPYQVSIALGSVVIAITGIWIFRKILIRYFSESITSMVMILIVLGTNYFQLTAYDGAMPHNVLFTLYGLITWMTIRWHEQSRWRDAAILGMAAGLSVLIRPTSIVIILVPLLWGIHDKQSLQHKWNLIRANYLQVLVMLSLLVAIPLLQFIYWLIHAGTFFFYSYEADQKLQLIAPYLWYVLFSFKKGWLIYAPVMLFPLVGLYFLAEKRRELFYSTFLFFMVNLLIIASWPTWWYGGSLGQRALMESYIILGLPLGFFIQWLFTRKLLTRVTLSAILGFFVLLNLFQTWQYMNFIIDPALMTRPYYFAIFGKTKVTDTDRMLVEGYKPDAGDFLRDKGKFNSVLAFYDFENRDFPYTGNLNRWTVKNGQFSFKMDQGMPFSPGIRINYGDLTKKPQAGIRISAWIFSRTPFLANPVNIVATSNHEGINYRYESLFLEKQNLAPNQWHQVQFNYLTPEYPDPKDVLQVYIWYRGNSEIFVDDLKIELFEPKE